MTKVRKTWKSWSPKEYLNQYYVTPQIPSDEVAIFDFINSRLKDNGGRFKKALEFGSGPTLHHALALMPFVEELHLADYIWENLVESEKWLKNENDAHDWDVYFKGLTPKNVEASKKQLREKVKALHRGDLNLEHPLGKEMKYPLVASFYCADSATKSKSEWRRYMTNLAKLIEPGGTLLMSALRNSRGYKVGSRFFPSANINEVDIKEVLLINGFSPTKLDIKVTKVEEWREEGFDSIVLVKAIKNEE